MRKQLLLLKTLLVAVLMGAGVNAWADYTTAWQNTFDNVSTYSDGWAGAKSRSQSTYTVNQGTRSGDAKYISFSNNNYNTVWTYTLSDISAISSATDYIFEMDFALTRCNATGTTGMKITNSSDSELFKVLATGADPGKGSTSLVAGFVYTNGSASAESETVTMNTFRGGTLTWYNIIITSNATDGTDLTLTKCSDATETKTYHLSDDFVALGKIILDPGYGWTSVNQSYYGGGCFDNFILKTPEDVTSVSAPTGSITDFNGTSRTIELSTLTAEATIYYSETTNNKDVDEWTVYTAAFATTANPIYAYAKKGVYTSDVTTFATGAGTAVKLNKPTSMRTGANTYTITAVATSAYGVNATQTIHYTVNGGAEQTAASPAAISNVDGDIVAWATADKFGNSSNLNVTYVAAIPTGDAAWSYNLNSYPKDHKCTAIASALDTENGADMNDVTMYNLKEEAYPNLYIENASGWLLRNQESNAWKCQSARTSIAFNNVTTSDVIYIYAINDNSSVNCVYNVVNGEVKYNYSLQHYYIVPTTDGAVNVTFNTGSSINTVAVYNTSVSMTISDAGYATFSSTYALDFTGVTGATAYIANNKSGSNIQMLSVTGKVAANTGLVLKSTNGGEANVTIPVTSETGTYYTRDSETKNYLIGCSSNTTVNSADEGKNYVLSAQEINNAETVVWAPIGDDAATVTDGHAYLWLPADIVGLSRSLRMVFDDNSVTGISDATCLKDKGQMTNDVFNLNGQRVKKAAKGLYIVNGKKYIK